MFTKITLINYILKVLLEDLIYINAVFNFSIITMQ